jgi:hypothetical protein
MIRTTSNDLQRTLRHYNFGPLSLRHRADSLTSIDTRLECGIYRTGVHYTGLTGPCLGFDFCDEVRKDEYNAVSFIIIKSRQEQGIDVSNIMRSSIEMPLMNIRLFTSRGPSKNILTSSYFANVSKIREIKGK